MSNNFENFEEELKKGLNAQNQNPSLGQESSFDALNFDFVSNADREEADEAGISEVENNLEENQPVSENPFADGEEFSFSVESETEESASEETEDSFDFSNFGVVSDEPASDSVSDPAVTADAFNFGASSDEPATDSVSDPAVTADAFNFGASSDEPVADSVSDPAVMADAFNFGASSDEPATDSVSDPAVMADAFNFGASSDEPATDSVSDPAVTADAFNFGSATDEPASDVASEEVVEENSEVAIDENAAESKEETSADDMFNFGAASDETSVDDASEKTSDETFSFNGLGSVEVASGDGDTESEPEKNADDVENDAQASGNAEAPKTVKKIVRRAKPKKKRSVAGELVKIVIGGLLAFPLAHYIVWGIYLGTGKPAPGGLYPIPTPFIQESYRYAKDFPQIPQACWKCLLWGFDPARDLAPEPETTQIAKNEAPQSAPTEENVENTDALASGEVAFGDGDAFGGFEMDESEVAQTAAEYVKFRSENLPEYDAAEVTLDFDPANVEAFQTAMLKVSFLKDGEDGKKLADQARDGMKAAVKGKKADALNETVLAWLTKENHGKGIMIAGKVEKVVNRGDFKIMIVKVDGTKKEVKLISPKTIKNAKGKRYVFSGVIFDPDQDEKVESKKKDEILIWRGLFKALPAKKAKKAKKDDKKLSKVKAEAAPVEDATADTAPSENVNVEEATPAETANIEEAAPSENANAEDAAPVETANVEEVAPAENVNAEEAAPSENVNAEEAAPSETTNVEEAAPAENVNVEDAAPAETANVEEAAPSENVNAEEAASSENVNAEEAVPAENASAEEAAPAETANVEEAASSETVNAEEAVPAENASAEEAAPAETVNAEEAAPSENANAEDAAPAETANVEEAASSENVNAEEAAPSENANAEEAVPAENANAEEAASAE